MTRLLDTLNSLETAEDFLDYFSIPYDQRVVDVNRLHILQRFHDRLAEVDTENTDEKVLNETVSTLLSRAYQDFVTSDARAEKVFKVFHDAGRTARSPRQTMVPLGDVRGVARRQETTYTKGHK